MPAAVCGFVHAILGETLSPRLLLFLVQCAEQTGSVRICQEGGKPVRPRT